VPPGPVPPCFAPLGRCSLRPLHASGNASTVPVTTITQARPTIPEGVARVGHRGNRPPIRWCVSTTPQPLDPHWNRSRCLTLAGAASTRRWQARPRGKNMNVHHVCRPLACLQRRCSSSRRQCVRLTAGPERLVSGRAGTSALRRLRSVRCAEGEALAGSGARANRAGRRSDDHRSAESSVRTARVGGVGPQGSARGVRRAGAALGAPDEAHTKGRPLKCLVERDHAGLRVSPESRPGRALPCHRRCPGRRRLCRLSRGQTRS
jgi:hypothetical protein